jgi:hypothetical protein
MQARFRKECTIEISGFAAGFLCPIAEPVVAPLPAVDTVVTCAAIRRTAGPPTASAIASF